MLVTWVCVLLACLLLLLYRRMLYARCVAFCQGITAIIGYSTPVMGVLYNQEQVLREASRLGIVMSDKPVIGQHSYWPRYWQQFTATPLAP